MERIITELLSSENPADMQTAADLLKNGEVVGIPTETVYGLAADALNETAVRKIFKAKGRPQDNPLIVHVADIADMEKYALDIPQAAYTLAERFCPGPLTMVLKKRNTVPAVTSGGLNTVGIRIPAHTAARELIKQSGLALAAPSANISGSPSPTSAEHVMRDLGGKIPAVVDGGACPVGIESTVVSFESGECDERGGVRILRPGFVTADDISELGLNVLLDKGIYGEIKDGEKAASPGVKYKHYAPEADITLVSGDLAAFIGVIAENADEQPYAVIFDRDEEKYPFDKYFTYGDAPEEQAARLFGVLRALDETGAGRVFVRCPSKEGVGLAVYNRLLRAAGFKIINN